MDNFLYKKLNERKYSYSMNDEKKGLNEQQLKEKINTNLLQLGNVVEKEIFSGELEHNQQTKERDYLHEYIYKDLKQSVLYANSKVHSNLTKYGKATLTKADEQNAEEQKIEVFGNEAAQAATGKKGREEDSLLKYHQKETNAKTDLVSIREMNSLGEYQDFMATYLQKEDKTYRDELKKAKAAGRTEEEKKRIESAFFAKMRFSTFPFLKTFKKGWFGRRYTLDGKRIKTERGELSPEEYNKQLIETMALETDKGKVDDATLAENRRKKSVLLQNITKELLDFKLEPEQLTDKYLADHIVEIQQYADKLNAFEVLYGENTWFFYGNEGKKKTEATDREFLDLLENRLFRVSEKLNDFLDSHYRSHCIYRMGDGLKYHDKGFLTQKRPERHEFQKSREYRKEHLYAFGNGFDLYNTKSLGEEEKNQYYDKLEQERSLLNYSQYRDDVENTIKDGKNEQVKLLARAVSDIIKDDMQKKKEEAEKAYADLTQEEKDRTMQIPYDNVVFEDGTKMNGVRQMLQSNPERYLTFAPELDYIYSKMYAASRLRAELETRQNVLRYKLRYKPELLKYQSKNPYAGFVSEMMTADMKKRMQEEFEGIDRKIEFLKYSQKVCQKSMKYFLSDRGMHGLNDEDMHEVSNFMRHENLEYMFDIQKADVYDDILDESIREAEAEIYKKDTGKEMPEELKQSKVPMHRDRAVIASNIRRRYKLRHDTDNAITNYVMNNYKEGTLILALVDLKPEEFSQFNFKTQIPMDKENSARNMIRYQLETTAASIMAGQSKVLNKNLLQDRTFMADFHKLCIEQRRIPIGMSLDHFMQDVQLKVEILAAHYSKSSSLMRLQQDKNYAYFDVDRLGSMTLDQIDAMRRILKKKLEAKQNAADQVDGVANRKRKKKLQSEADAIRELDKMIERYQLGAKNSRQYSDISGEVYESMLNRRVRTARVQHARKTEYFNANENYIDIKDLLDSKEVEGLLDNWIPAKIEEQRKKKGRADDKVTKEVLVEKAAVLAGIPTDETLTDLLKTITADVHQPVDTEALKKLIGYYSVIRFFDDALYRQGSEEFPLSPVYSDMREMLAREENAVLKNEIETKLTVLAPLKKIVLNYLYFNGFSGVRGGSDYPGEENLQGRKNEYLNELKTYGTNLEEQKVLLNDNLAKMAKGMDTVLRDYTEELFERIYRKGGKLNLSDIEKWKAKVTAMTKEGFFKESKDEYWLRLTAKNMLANWPYSFHEFYAKRMEKDTGKAIKIQLENYAGKKGARMVNADHAAEISLCISQVDTNLYHALPANETKELDRALAANGYDPFVFKYLMETVEVNGVNMPLQTKDRIARQENMNIARIFRNRFHADGTTNEQGQEDWRTFVVEQLSSITDLELSTDLLNEEYIQKHFRHLYKLSRKISAIRQIYEKEKEFIFSDEAKEKFFVTDQDLNKLRNYFEAKGNQFLGKFTEMIDAYARMHMVDERGVFDIGPTTEDKNAMLDNIEASVSKRKEQFERLKDQLGIELRRNQIAYKAIEAEKINAVLQSIPVDSNDKITKFLQKKDFQGNLDDVNLLLHHKILDKRTKEYLNAKKQYNYDQKQMLKEVRRMQEYNSTGDEIPEKLKKSIADRKKRIEENRYTIQTVEREIQDSIVTSQKIYRYYNFCHDENGNLNSIEKGKSEENTLKMQTYKESYANFHRQTAPDVRETFEAFQQKLKDPKQKGKLFDRHALAERMMSEDWPDEYREYKKLHLYFGLLEQDEKHFQNGLFSTDQYVKEIQNQNASMEKEIKNFDKQHKNDMLPKVQQEREILVRKKNDLADAEYMLTKAIKDTKTIKAVHDYVAFIHTVYMEHGVYPDGRMLEKQIDGQAGNVYSEDDKYQIVHENEGRGLELAKEMEKKQKSK